MSLGAFGGANLRQALLSGSDLPSGFVLNVNDDDDSDHHSALLNSDNVECSQFNGLTKKFTNKTAFTSTAYLNKTSRVYLLESLASFTSSDSASDALADMRTLLDECPSWTETSSSDPHPTHIELKPYSMPDLGDESVAFELNATVHYVSLSGLILMFRVGNTAAFLMYGQKDLYGEPMLFNHLAHVAARKVSDL